MPPPAPAWLLAVLLLVPPLAAFAQTRDRPAADLSATDRTATDPGTDRNDPVRNGAATALPMVGGRDRPTSPGGQQATSPVAPSIFPDRPGTVAPDQLNVGVSARCAALTDPVERDACARGSITGQPEAPPTRLGQ